MSAPPSQPPTSTCPLCPNSKADLSDSQKLKNHNSVRHNLVYTARVDVGLPSRTELTLHRPNPTGSLSCPSPRCSGSATTGNNIKTHVQSCNAARVFLGGVVTGKAPPPPPPPSSSSSSSLPRPPSTTSNLPNLKRKASISTSTLSTNGQASSLQPTDSPSPDLQQRKRARHSLVSRSTEPGEEMEVDVNEPTDDTVDPKWYTLEMGHELMWAVVNLKDKNGIALASEFYVYPDLDVHVDYLMQIPDAFTLRDVQDHLDTGSHASLYYVKKYLDGCFKQARDYFPADHRLHKAAVQLTAIVKQTYDYLPFAVDASPSPTALIYGKPTPYVVRPPRPFTDEGFDHIVDFTAKKLHRTNNQSRRSLYGLSPDFFDELASQDIPSATWYLFYVKGTKKFSSAIRPMTKAIRTTLGKLQGDVNANAGGEDAMVDASAGSGTVAASGAVRTAAPPIMLGSPRPRPPAVAPNAAKPSITRPLHPPTVPSTSTPSSEPSSSTLPASMSKPKVLPPPTVASSTPNVRPSGVAPTPKQAGWLSGLLKETIAAAAPDSGSASTSATSPPTRASVVHRAPQPFPQTLSSTSPSDALSPPSDLATPTNPSSVAPSFPVASAPTLDEPNSTVEESTAVVDESQRPDEPEVAMEPAPSPSSTQPISSSATPMDTSETLPLFASEPKSEETSSKDEGQDAFNELLLLSQGVASYGMEASDDEDEDDVDFGSMSHEEFVAYTDRNKASTKPFSTSPTPSPFPTLPLTSSSAASRPSSISTESTTLRLENTRLSTRNSELRSCLDDLSEKMKRGKEEHASQVQALHAALASKDAQLVVLKDATEADWRARFVKLEEEKEALEAKWKAKELEEERKAEERRAALAALMGTL